VVVVWHEGIYKQMENKKTHSNLFWSFHLGSCRCPWDRRQRWSGVKERAVGWLWLWLQVIHQAGGGVSVSWMSVKILIAPFFGWVVLGAIVDAHGPCAFLGCYAGRLSTGEGAGQSC
jgi:hypothetical protein